jgi:hypothetical protein
MSLRSLTLEPNFLTKSRLSLQGLVVATMESHEKSITPTPHALGAPSPIDFPVLHHRLNHASILTTKDAATVYYVAASTMVYIQSHPRDQSSVDFNQTAPLWFDLAACARDFSDQARALLSAESQTLIHQLIELDLRLEQLRRLNLSQPIPPLAQNAVKPSLRRKEMRDLLRSTEADWMQQAHELCALCRIHPALLLPTIPLTL